jgi:2-polyprenyl-6-methoxyphenol hydroxylase-like FAD-dependent oxidoreductase
MLEFMVRISVRGEGVAACCCARLLQDAGLGVQVESTPRSKQPAIMLGRTAQKLFGDIFQREDLFDGFPRIDKRIVQWGSGAEMLVLPHSAVVASERLLLERIRPEVTETVGDIDWSIFAARPLPAGSPEHSFGSRTATATPVLLNATAELGACWIESLPNGWLFLLPEGDQRAWMLSVGESPEVSLSSSGLIARRIAEVRGQGASFPSHPRIADSLAAPGWLACGTAAIGFDPLCGDGAGNATREAILASAVIRAAAVGEDTGALITHYRTLLIAGFARHLAACDEFYRRGQNGAWWQREIQSTREGLAWCSQELAGSDPPRFRLNDFVLERTD